MSTSSHTVQFKGLQELQAFNKALPQILTDVSNRTLAKWGRTFNNDTQNRVPVRTGRLKRSGGFQAGNLFLSLFYNEHYAHYVDVGTSRFSGRHYFAKVLLPQAAKVIDDMNRTIDSEFKSRLSG